MTTRNERLVDNQRTFRYANERLQALAGGVSGERLVPFLCECADNTCLGRVPMTLAVYDEIHTDRDLYVIMRHHAVSEGELVVDRHDGFDVARKPAA